MAALSGLGALVCFVCVMMMMMMMMQVQSIMLECRDASIQIENVVTCNNNIEEELNDSSSSSYQTMMMMMSKRSMLPKFEKMVISNCFIGGSSVPTDILITSMNSQDTQGVCDFQVHMIGDLKQDQPEMMLMIGDEFRSMLHSVASCRNESDADHVACTLIPNLLFQSVNLQFPSLEKTNALSLSPNNNNNEEDHSVLIPAMSIFIGIALLAIGAVTNTALRRSGALGGGNQQQEHIIEEPLLNVNVKPPLSSLAKHPIIPLSAKIAIPLLWTVALILFLTANALTGAIVDLRVRVQHHIVFSMALFEFSLVNTVRDMWLGEVYVLSLLVAGWSCAWVYIKALMLICSWFLPPSILSLKIRRRILLALDQLGKYCTLDIFLMCMMTVAFKFHISTSTIGVIHRILPKDFLIVDVSVDPAYGLYAFITATAISLMLNHSVLYMHRNAIGYDNVSDNPEVETDVRRMSSALSMGSQISDAVQASSSQLLYHRRRSSLDPYASKREVMCCPCPKGSWFDKGTVELIDTVNEPYATFRYALVNHHYLHPIPYITKPTKQQALMSENMEHIGSPLSLPFIIVMTSSMFISVVLIFCFVFIDTFDFTFKGLAGTLINLVAPELDQNSYSISTIAAELGNDPNDPGVHVGPLYIQICFILFSVALPIVNGVTLIWIWFTPLSLREMKIGFYALEVSSAWAALDVYILAIVASLAEINQFSLFLQAPICDPIKEALPVIKDCFIVDTTLRPACFMLIGVAMFSWCVNQVVTRLAERAIRDRESIAIARISSNDAGSLSAPLLI